MKDIRTVTTSLFRRSVEDIYTPRQLGWSLCGNLLAQGLTPIAFVLAFSLTPAS